MTVYINDTIQSLKERYGESLQVTDYFMRVNGYAYTKEEYESAFQRTDKEYIKKNKIGAFKPNWMETYSLEQRGSNILPKNKKYYRLDDNEQWVEQFCW